MRVVLPGQILSDAAEDDDMDTDVEEVKEGLMCECVSFLLGAKVDGEVFIYTFK